MVSRTSVRGIESSTFFRKLIGIGYLRWHDFMHLFQRAVSAVLIGLTPKPSGSRYFFFFSFRSFFSIIVISIWVNCSCSRYTLVSPFVSLSLSIFGKCFLCDWLTNVCKCIATIRLRHWIRTHTHSATVQAFRKRITRDPSVSCTLYAPKSTYVRATTTLACQLHEPIA